MPPTKTVCKSYLFITIVVSNLSTLNLAKTDNQRCLDIYCIRAVVSK